MQFGRLSLKRCRHGWMLYAKATIIGKCLDLYGEYSESEVAAMRTFLRPGDTVIDVGANTGDLTLPLANIVGTSGRVYAIESNPANFHVLCANLALNDIRNTKAINAFVKPDSSAIPAESMRFTGGGSLPVASLAIDSLDLDACALIKLDVDGGELGVLESAAMQIERLRPVLYFENDVQAKSPELLRYAKGLGYDLYFHQAAVFSNVNFFGNPEHAWGDHYILSLMILGVPSERRTRVALRPVTGFDEWFDYKFENVWPREGGPASLV